MKKEIKDSLIAEARKTVIHLRLAAAKHISLQESDEQIGRAMKVDERIGLSLLALELSTAILCVASGREIEASQLQFLFDLTGNEALRPQKVAKP